MKRIGIVVFCLLFFCSCSHSVIAQEKVVPKPDATTVADTLKTLFQKNAEWQIKYYEERLRAIALEYTGLCFKDVRWIESKQEIERLGREMKQFLKNN